MFIFLKNRASVFSPSRETMNDGSEERRPACASGLNKRPEPLQYQTSLTFSSLFFFFLNSKPTISIWEKQQQQKKILEPIYLHVLLSKGKELIMNDLSIMFPSAGQGQSQQ